MSSRLDLIVDWQERARLAKYDRAGMAESCGVSVRHLDRYFKERFGCTLQMWLDDLKLLASRAMLLSGLPAKNVALSCGYKQATHFYRKFKEKFHLTPLECAVLYQQSGECPPQIVNVFQG